MIDPRTVTIKDIKYGNSYDPYIIRAYKGTTKIFERDTWLYHVKNIDLTDTAHNISNYAYFQPEATVGYSIKPFSYMNVYRDWEIVINASPKWHLPDGSVDSNYTSQSKCAIGCISNDSSSGGTRYGIELCLYPGGLYIDASPTSMFVGFDPSAGDGRNKTFACDVVNKDIHIVKRTEEIGGEDVVKMYFYVDDVLLNTLKVNSFASTGKNMLTAGYSIMGSNYFFDGTINYYKMRYNTDVKLPEWSESNYINIHNQASTESPWRVDSHGLWTDFDFSPSSCDGFGVEFAPGSITSLSGYQVGHFFAGGSAHSGYQGSLDVHYDSERTGDSTDSIDMMGGRFSGLFKKYGRVKVIYFHDRQQMIAFDEDMNVVGESSIYASEEFVIPSSGRPYYAVTWGENKNEPVPLGENPLVARVYGVVNTFRLFRITYISNS